MFTRIVVPIDGSERSWATARMAVPIAAECSADLELLQVVHAPEFVDDAAADLERGIAAMGRPSGVRHAVVADDDVAAAIERYVEQVSGSMVMMASTGRGRSAAVLGSVADELLRATFGPIIVVGPNVQEVTSFAGDIVVPVDESSCSETSLPIAAAWGIGFGATPWIVQVLPETPKLSADVMESSHVARTAKQLASASHHDVEFEVLHGHDVAEAIDSFAGRLGASLIVMSTHGRTGLRRLTMGSTAASVVHGARCPVVLHRPPVFAQ